MNKTQTPQTSPAQGSAPMDIDVNIYRPSAQGPVLADASVTIGGCFAIRGIKIKEGKNGPFVSMPSRIVNGEYKDVCFPCTKEFKQQFDQTVLGAYQQAMDQSLQQRQGPPQGQYPEQHQEQYQDQTYDGPPMGMSMGM